ncbi:Glycosyl phosphatidyl inositol anchor synthesis [Ascosphaera aggregata]|nr:Glycosyl phosphatidyl inositol anchor synthesis [Ascosphaera aggregata]
MTVVTWVRLEHTLFRHKQTVHNGSQISGSGSAKPGKGEDSNIASISSFSLDSVQRLIPVFNPFSQGALLIFKILVPFAIISANLGILNRRLTVAPSALFMLVMAISDILTLNFFYMVKDEGSWLDIGTTISHFCIASGLCTFVAGLEFLSEVFISGVRFEVAIEGSTGPTAVGSKIAGQALEKISDVTIGDDSVPGPAVDQQDTNATAPHTEQEHVSPTQ